MYRLGSISAITVAMMTCSPAKSPRPANSNQRPKPVRKVHRARDVAVPQGTPTKTFRAKWEASMNRHGAGRRSATGRRIIASMELALWENHTARLKDSGMRSRSVLHSLGYSANQTDWKNTWRGTWKRSGKQLVLTLRLAKHHCVRTDSNRRTSATIATKKRGACPEARKNIVIQCKHAVIALWPHNKKPTLPKYQRSAWRCAPKGDDVTTNGSPTPWVFGKKGCLLQMGSRRLHYKACK